MFQKSCKLMHKLYYNITIPLLILFLLQRKLLQPNFSQTKEEALRALSERGASPIVQSYLDNWSLVRITFF